MAAAAPAIMAISALVTTATTVYSAVQQHAAGDEAKELAERNAQMQRLETEEEAKRLEKTQERTSAMARARAYASGIDPESVSTQLVLADLETTQREELDWLRKSGYSRADILSGEGDIAKSRAETEGISTFGSAAGQVPKVYSAGQTAGWWK